MSGTPFDFSPILGGLGLLFGGGEKNAQLQAQIDATNRNNETRLADAFAQIKQRADESNLNSGADSRDASLNPLQKELEALMSVFIRGR